VHAQINGDKVVVFDFWATWCGPCRVISPIFERLSEQYLDVEFYKVDVEEAPEVASEVRIRAVRGARLVEIAPEG
jgi:thioredoxin 1